MARSLRLEFAGAIYHVTSRGDRQEAIYETNEDRENFLKLLGESCDQYNWRCHGYCLMTNHFHLLLETPDGNLSKGYEPMPTSVIIFKRARCSITPMSSQ